MVTQCADWISDVSVVHLSCTSQAAVQAVQQAQQATGNAHNTCARHCRCSSIILLYHGSLGTFKGKSITCGTLTMGDPLSLAAGVVGLVSLTIQLLQVATKFSKDVKGASEEARLLIEEMESLKSVLELLKKAWENREVPANFDLSALARIEATCEAHLKELLEQLKKDENHLQK